MQEQSRRQQARAHVPEVDDLIESVELAGVMKTEEHERSQTENIEMQRLLRTAPAEIHEQPDNEVRRAHQVLIHHGPVQRNLAHDYFSDIEFQVAALDVVRSREPGRQVSQDLGHVQRHTHRYSVAGMLVDGFLAIRSHVLFPGNADQHIALPHPGAISGAVARHSQRPYLPAAVSPDHTVIVQTELDGFAGN